MKDKKWLWTIVVVIALMAALLLLKLCVNQPESPGKSSIQPDASELPVPGAMVYEGPDTNVGHMGYLQSGNELARLADATLRDTLELQKTSTTLYTGHTIYKGNDGHKYIISGQTPYQLAALKIRPENYRHIREEESCQLILITELETEADRLQKARQAGEKLLKAPSNSGNAIVLNSFLLESGAYFFDEDTCWISVLPVFDFLGQTYQYRENVSFNLIYNQSYVCLPFINVPNPWATEAAAPGMWRYESNLVQEWSAEFPMLRMEDGKPYISAEALSRVFGWEIRAADNLVTILTDELDVPSKIVACENKGD